METVGGRKKEILRTYSHPNDKRWEAFKKIYRDIDIYFRMDRNYCIKNEGMESY